MYTFSLEEIKFYPDNPLVLMAGPCVIESRDHSLFMADSSRNSPNKTGSRSFSSHRF
jgi:3-deoxy-D-manno-octulosonic acid (KDO) 8-phosphate synthase